MNKVQKNKAPKSIKTTTKNKKGRKIYILKPPYNKMWIKNNKLQKQKITKNKDLVKKK